jgi:hypothetical protein
MIITRPTNKTDGSCVDCGEPAMTHVRFQYSEHSSQSFTLCRRCQGLLAGKLLPPMKKASLPRQALQAVFEMACELAHASEYSAFANVATKTGMTTIRTGPRADVATVLMKVKEHFKLKGDVD